MAQFHLQNGKAVMQAPVEAALQYDVVVCGGGVAGVAAAVAAARKGAKTLLIERGGMLGGTATAGMCASFVGTDRKIIRGIYAQIVERMQRISPVIISDPMTFDPETMRTVLTELLEESGSQLLLHTAICAPVVGDGQVKGVVLSGKSGMFAVLAKVIVDATGDGDVAAQAGASFGQGRQEDGVCQPMSVLFRMGGVDVRALLGFVREHPEEFYEDPIMKNIDLEQDPPCICLRGMFSAIRREKEEKTLYLDHGSVGIICMPRQGDVLMNATEVRGLDPVDPFEKTKAELEGRKQTLSIVHFMQRNVPGFENAYLIDTGSEIGVRESRRIIGEYVMTREDILENRRFDDAIAYNSFPMDFHGTVSQPHGNVMIYGERSGYSIPYRSLIPKELEGILVAGRCISATHEAHASIRNMPACMATGQAAGAAAAIAAAQGVEPRQIDVQELRTYLRTQDVIC